MSTQQDPLAAAFAAQTQAGAEAGSQAIQAVQARDRALQTDEGQEKLQAAASALPPHQWDTARLEQELQRPPAYQAGGTHQPQSVAPIQTHAGHPVPQPSPTVPTIPVSGEPLVDVIQDSSLGRYGSALRILARLGVQGEPAVEIKIPLSTVFQRIPAQDISAMLAQGGSQPQQFTWTLQFPNPTDPNKPPSIARHQGSQPPGEKTLLVAGGIQQFWVLENAAQTSPTEGVAHYRMTGSRSPRSPQEIAAEANARAQAAAMKEVGAFDRPPQATANAAPPSANPFQVDPGPTYQPPPGHQVHNANPWSQ